MAQFDAAPAEQQPCRPEGAVHKNGVASEVDGVLELACL